MARYAARVLDALLTYLPTAIETQIGIIETEELITLPNIYDYRVGEWFELNLSPFVFMYTDKMEKVSPAGQRNIIYDVTSILCLRYKMSPDIANDSKTVLHYLTAIIDAINADPTLGGLVSVCLINEISIGAIEQTDSSETSYGVTIDLTIRIHENPR
ncbi:MAG: hypothetical protein HC877_20705 [Thioploca sp.]|nr:hypothetical protein [Thioploca sp.]